MSNRLFLYPTHHQLFFLHLKRKRKKMKKEKWITQVHGLNVAVIIMFILTLFSHKFSDYYLGKAHIFRTCTSNEAAISQAIKHIESGRKYILLRGLLSINDADEKRMSEEEKQYGFMYIGTGCVGVISYVQVYDQVMRRYVNDLARKYVFRTFDKYTLENFKKRSKY
jgi:hypothetical protein